MLPAFGLHIYCNPKPEHADTNLQSRRALFAHLALSQRHAEVFAVFLGEAQLVAERFHAARHIHARGQEDKDRDTGAGILHIRFSSSRVQQQSEL